MITRDILETAIYAPSGDNVQPWKFKITESTIDIFNVPENDTSFYNFNQSASFIGHGALLENIVILAGAMGYSAEYNIFPRKEDQNYVAHIEIRKAQEIDKNSRELADYIKLRTTNRKEYKDIALNTNEKEALRRAASTIDDQVKLNIVDDKKVLETLTAVTSNNERLVFENKMLHDFFYGHLIWNDEEAKGKIGFNVKTLELPPPGLFAFRIFKNWPLVGFLNKFGLAKSIGKQGRKLHASAPAMGAIIVKDTSPLSYIETGRAMQRVWLEVTRLGLSLQPITGILFFMPRIKADAASELSHSQIDLIQESYGTMENVFESQGNVISFMFRVGRSEKPTIYTTRLPLEQMLIAP